MRNLLLIARREYLEQIRGRAFRVSTILVPLLFAVIIGVAFLSGRGSGVGKHVIVAAPSAMLGNDIRDEMMKDKDAKTRIDVVAPATPAQRAALVDMVQSKKADGLLWVETAPNGATTATYTSQSSGDIVISSRLSAALNHALAIERMTARGMSDADVDALLKDVKVDTLQLDKQRNEVKSSGFGSYMKGYIMALLLSMTTMIYGMNVARSIIQEKTSRIFEVMLATAKPSDLLAGKLIGVGAVGLTQIAIWVIAGTALAGTALAAPLLSGQFAIHFSWAEGILFPVYFVLGYLLYASLFAGLAASCETEQELQMYTPLAALPIWLSFSLIWLVINDPGSAWSIGASLFPATAPIIMMLRMGSQIPPAWQFAVSIAIMILSIWVVLWISSRLYRVGILMYGKRATIPELVRWLRYS
ncbi:MAG TPA: ABC transporter permease [Terracidiphilus sp.]|jgi:ABC-2 type transport system permease protein|nr:ABC transporter permease [Terracidiphilus sp.]